MQVRSALVFGVALVGCSTPERKTGAGASDEPRAAATAKSSALNQAAFEIQRVSLSSDNAELVTCTSARPACKNNSHPTMSYDGQRVVFDSDALQVVPGFINTKHAPQIYLRDVSNGQTTLISAARDAQGTIVPPDDGHQFGEISPDGAYVAFESGATNLVDSENDPKSDVFLVRVEPFEITCLTSGLDGDSTGPSLSADARFVSFVSSASTFPNLKYPDGTAVGTGPSLHQNVFLLDRSNGAFEWLSINPLKAQSNGAATQASTDDTGQRIAFVSEATDMGIDDPNGADPDVFVIDRMTAKISCVSVRFDGLATGNGVSRKPAISGNGRYVVFESTATDLLAPGVDTNNRSDIFVRDIKVGVTTRISTSDAGVQGNGQSGYAAISPDGRFIGFTSFARNLMPGDPPRGFAQFYLRDRDVSGNGTFDEPGDMLTLRMSRSVAGTPANARTGGNCDLSASGATAVFMSESDLLVPGDQNGAATDAKCSPTCLFGRDVFRASFQ